MTIPFSEVEFLLDKDTKALLAVLDRQKELKKLYWGDLEIMEKHLPGVIQQTADLIGISVEQLRIESLIGYELDDECLSMADELRNDLTGQ